MDGRVGLETMVRAVDERPAAVARLGKPREERDRDVQDDAQVGEAAGRPAAGRGRGGHRKDGDRELPAAHSTHSGTA